MAVKIDEDLAQRALVVGGGNPGLQAMLSKPILAGEVNAATRALDAIEHFQRTGVPPADIAALIKNGVAKDAPNAVVAFFKRMAFDTYRAALAAQQVEMLRATCVFSSEQIAKRPRQAELIQ